MNECYFCNKKEEDYLAFNNLAFSFTDTNPVSPGHSLVVPRRHQANYFDLTPLEIQSMLKLIEQVKYSLEEKYHPDGYNIGINIGEAAGQTVPHVHIHLIPRFHGDTENPRGGVRGVIPSKQNY